MSVPREWAFLRPVGKAGGPGLYVLRREEGEEFWLLLKENNEGAEALPHGSACYFRAHDALLLRKETLEWPTWRSILRHEVGHRLFGPCEGCAEEHSIRTRGDEEEWRNNYPHTCKLVHNP